MITSQRVEWKGKEYEIKYSFKLIQRLKAEGINVSRIYRLINENPNSAGDHADDVAALVCYCLREAGAAVDVSETWELCLNDVNFATACWALFQWLVLQHYAQSANAPKPKKTRRQG